MISLRFRWLVRGTPPVEQVCREAREQYLISLPLDHEVAAPHEGGLGHIAAECGSQRFVVVSGCVLHHPRALITVPLFEYADALGVIPIDQKRRMSDICDRARLSVIYGKRECVEDLEQVPLSLAREERVGLVHEQDLGPICRRLVSQVLDEIGEEVAKAVAALRERVVGAGTVADNEGEVRLPHCHSELEIAVLRPPLSKIEPCGERTVDFLLDAADVAIATISNRRNQLLEVARCRYLRS